LKTSNTAYSPFNVLPFFSEKHFINNPKP